MARNNNKKKQRNKNKKNKNNDSQVNLNDPTEKVVDDDNNKPEENNIQSNEIELEQSADDNNTNNEEQETVEAGEDEVDLDDAPETEVSVQPVEKGEKEGSDNEIEMDDDDTGNEIKNPGDDVHIKKDSIEQNTTNNDAENVAVSTDANETVEREVTETEPGKEEIVNIPGSPVTEEQSTDIQKNDSMKEPTTTVDDIQQVVTSIETNDEDSASLVEKESTIIQKEIDENFPNKEPELIVEHSKDEQQPDNTEGSMGDEIIELGPQNDGTESTITSSVPALPPRHTDIASTPQEGLAPPPLPARTSSLEDNLSHTSNSEPLNQKSMILNRLDLTIKDLKDNDRFVERPKEDIISQSDSNDSIWINIINDPVQNIPIAADTLQNEIIKGIDPTLRPLLWKSLTLGYCRDWEPIYKALEGKTSIKDNDFIVKQIQGYQGLQETDIESVFNILSALVSLDATIQPTSQAIALAVTIYKVYENELDSFGVMVTLLKSYDWVALYSENSENLAMLLYQFDRLLEENCHDLYTHLIKKGLRSSMFASDWLLSSFASTLPVKYIPQILDVVVLEGIPALLKFSLALMMKNEDNLLQLEFDDLFFYCKNRLFEPYVQKDTTEDESEISAKNEEDTDLNNESDASSVEYKRLIVLTEDNFDVHQFVTDAIEKTRITPELLKRYSDEYVEIHRNELAQEEQFQQMRDENFKLQNEVRELERDYTSLNREHVTIANELLQNHIKIEGVTEANTRMKMEILQLRKQLDTQIKKNNSNTSILVPSDIQKDLEMTLKKNGKVMQQNLIYQDRITSLEKLISDIKTATAEGIDYDAANGISSSAFKSPLLSGGWTGLKKVFK
ncbi:similar to Saccharomyces cerevisiae YPL249C GYP5 GTPase-activating protein (GAP) for yeast Rab family members [Maudiozyma saulgeensis]|uniref:Similar to Saccharomyces cerevisiae YPL249C GYP5 GTPase-activating protein (GAP) for yeast Rab family members n=1 Tax=Maudiozyma saulgeensis TaxID=1789683 RepID=A0A1X7R0D2_9SACH|nr:similar to Saccharomyces cerevisiae YPL249C GYP5 GTPase-activating protein (GAP) for yeast Rab family members [Kazachstania saulgeensis]